MTTKLNRTHTHMLRTTTITTTMQVYDDRPGPSHYTESAGLTRLLVLRVVDRPRDRSPAVDD